MTTTEHAIAEYSAERDDRDSKRWLAFNELNVGRLQRSLLRFEFAMGTGAGAGGKAIKVYTLHPDRPQEPELFRICFETKQDIRTRSSDVGKGKNALVNKTSWLFQVPAPFVTAMREVLDAEMRWAMTSREQPLVLSKTKKGATNGKSMWETKAHDKTLAEWALAGGINLYKDVWDSMNIDRSKKKLSDLESGEYEEFRHALAARTAGPRAPDGSDDIDAKPWIKPLVYASSNGDEMLAIAMKNYRDGAPILVEGSDKTLQQTKLFRWETDEAGELVKKALTTEEGLAGMTHTGEPYIFTCRIRWSLKHWWIESKGGSGAFHLETVELLEGKEDESGFTTLDIGAPKAVKRKAEADAEAPEQALPLTQPDAAPQPPQEQPAEDEEPSKRARAGDESD